MPTIRGKLSWDVLRHEWSMQSNDPKAKKVPKNKRDWDAFPVYPILDAQSYEHEKFAQYCCAIAIWNSREASTSRHQIPVPLKSGAGSQPSQDQ